MSSITPRGWPTPKRTDASPTGQYRTSLTSSARKKANGLMASSTAADVGCLIGEMHLRRGEYHEAYNTALEMLNNAPPPELREGLIDILGQASYQLATSGTYLRYVKPGMPVITNLQRTPEPPLDSTQS